MEAYEKHHLELLRKLLPECTVLLKKDGSFPLASPCSLAVYGSGVRHTVKGGTGSGEVNSRFFVTAEKGLQEAGFTLTTQAWLDGYDRIRREAKKSFLRQIRIRARKKHTLAMIEGMGAVMPEPEYALPLTQAGDAAVYILSRVSGEGADRNPVPGDILLTESEKRDILALNKRFQKFMLVLNTGGPVDLSPVAEVGNILVLSQLGAETGHALADLLLGKAFPSGRLTTTWAAWKDYPEIGDFGDPDDTCYHEGIYVGYRWFEAVEKKPLFPFGAGTGYTDFETEVLEADRHTVSVRVRNTGSFAGKKTVLLYIAPPRSELDKPFRVLVAFQKTGELLPGQCETLRIPFSLRDAASYDPGDAAWVLEEGCYTVMAEEKPVLSLCLDRRVVLSETGRLTGDPGFTDWKPEAVHTVLPAERQLSPAEEDLIPEPDNPAPPETVDPRISRLSDEKLCMLAVGAFDPKGGLMSLIGNASMSVAGAAGESCSLDGNLPALVMADGPAGLRLSRSFFRDSKGLHSLESSLPEAVRELMPKPLRFFTDLTSPKPKKGDRIQHQYCTAIPVGTAVAQSWNLALAGLCGDIVGEEMERFGIHLWLAPALNIHRSIRCGRNFEYFSEDPLLSGKMAASIAKAVRNHPGCGVTLKHFAANNQETNRYNSNSHVSERALREIYLRGFEIAVKEARPCALMTSYNLLNGVHTSERDDLINGLLRREWKFDGLVMTDWVVRANPGNRSPRYPAPEPWKTAAAGSDLFMPGGKSEYRNVLLALKKSLISRTQLELSASRVLRWAEELAGKHRVSEI